MKNSVFKKASAVAFSVLFSATAFAGGGSTYEILPAPNTCTSNCGFTLGPDPSLNFVQAEAGPLPVSSTVVSSSVDGFGGGTIYYPSNVSSEMGTIAVSPGYTARQDAIEWWGPLLASHGFVVITIDTNSRFDQPESRGRQLDSALTYLISEGNRSSSTISGLIDESRLATMGHSMGGGGALHSASRNRLSAAAPMAPFNSGSNPYASINVPTMIFACQNDIVAPVNSHSLPFYNVIPASTDKVMIEVAGGSHSCANGRPENNRPLLSTYGLSWMKRFLDKDSRYNQFLCGPNHTANSAISDFRDTCNF